MNLQISPDPVVNARKKKALHRSSRACAAALYAFAALAILSLIGVIVAILMLGFGQHSEERDLLLYILSGSFTGGALLFALSALGFSRVMNRAVNRELDFRERCAGEESFFVGEGTLMTFGDEGITLHDETGSKHQPIRVAYRELRFISVCTRTRPREKGEWCVAVEIPAKYLVKNEGKSESRPVLVQADAKQRLYDALKAHNLTLLGEQPVPQPERKKYEPVHSFYTPDPKKRRNALIVIVLGSLLTAAGIVIAVLVALAVGALLAAAGVLLLVRSLFSYFRARDAVKIYREGIYRRDCNRNEGQFIKWEELETLQYDKQTHKMGLCCTYGCMYFYAPFAAFDAATEFIPEKCVFKEKEEK